MAECVLPRPSYRVIRCVMCALRLLYAYLRLCVTLKNNSTPVTETAMLDGLIAAILFLSVFLEHVRVVLHVRTMPTCGQTTCYHSS